MHGEKSDWMRKEREMKGVVAKGRRKVLTPAESELTGAIIGAAIEVHRVLGPAMLESTSELIS